MKERMAGTRLSRIWLALLAAQLLFPALLFPVLSFAAGAEDAPASSEPRSDADAYDRTARESEAPIPKKPSAPAVLAQPSLKDAFQCQRYFVYKGNRLDCDSHVRRDGESLRPILALVPKAEEELNTYQTNRRNLRTASYTTTAGLFAVLVGFALDFATQKNNSRIFDPHGSLTPGGILAFTGLAVSFESFVYSLSVSRGNESHLGNAVEVYNQAKPEQPIQLEFSTKILF
jgi:hypothetical protein